MKLYLAGPDVFFPNAEAHGRHLKETCLKYGHVGFFPLDDELDDSMDIFQANCAMISLSDAVIANLTPFRGPSADAGTLIEVGLAYGLRKPIIAWSERRCHYRDRVLPSHVDELGRIVDANGNLIENFGLMDNLMAVHPADAIFGSFEEAVEKASQVVSCRYAIARKSD